MNTAAAEILYNQVVNDLRECLSSSSSLLSSTSSTTLTTTNTASETADTAETVSDISPPPPPPTTTTTTTTEINVPKIQTPLLCLDVCCGTGTIGIICSKANLGSVVGIEMCAAAVENAKINAKLNGLHLLNEPNNENKASEAAFICSRAEVVLENILNDRRSPDSLINQVQYLARGKKLLAVVDPPREVNELLFISLFLDFFLDFLFLLNI